jgi:hypothetical protein
MMMIINNNRYYGAKMKEWVTSRACSSHRLNYKFVEIFPRQTAQEKAS